jgi:hypothetical protein
MSSVPNGTTPFSQHPPNVQVIAARALTRLEQGPCTLADLKEFALMETVFKKSHTEPAVHTLNSERRVERTSARRHEDVVVTLAARLFW